MPHKTPTRLAAGAWAALFLVVLAGCHELEKQPGKSPLRQVQMSHDSMAIDIVFARFPYGDPEFNTALWSEIDEQHFPAELRQRLTKNGFRVGLVGGQVPMALSKLLEMTDRPDNGDAAQTRVTDLEKDPKVTCRHVQIRPGRRTEIQASGVYEELPVLTCEPRGVCGKTYYKAQGVFALEANPEHDGRVRFDLLPEVHHGEARLKSIPTASGMRLEPGRAKQVFDALACQAILSPGQLIVVTALPQRPGSLGHYFFTDENGGKREQKLMLIRLSQTQHDELFDPHRVLPLDLLTEAK